MKKWLKILMVILGIVLILIIGYIIIALTYSYFNSSQYECWKIGGTWEKAATKEFCNGLKSWEQCSNSSVCGKIVMKSSGGMSESFVFDHCEPKEYCNCPEKYQMQYNFCK